MKDTMVLEGTYDEAVKMMGDISFLSALMNFPKEQINDETVELLKPYFSAPDFNFNSAKKVLPILTRSNEVLKYTQGTFACRIVR